MNPLEATKAVLNFSGKRHADVARMVGAKASTISHYCVGDHYPNIAMFAEICKACGVSAIIKNGEVFLGERTD